MTPLQRLQTLPDAQFQAFFAWCPYRTQIGVRSGLCSFGVLVEWYEKYLYENVHGAPVEVINAEDIPW